MKTLNAKMTTLMIAASALMLSILPFSKTMAQPSEDILDVANDLKEFYFGPIESEGYILTMYTDTVDFETIDQEELGYAILGGLVLSYASAGKKDNIGVVIIGSAEEAVAMSMSMKTFKKYIKGKIDVDEMLALTTSENIPLDEVPSF
jgi:hypothetical protein